MYSSNFLKSVLTKNVILSQLSNLKKLSISFQTIKSCNRFNHNSNDIVASVLSERHINNTPEEFCAIRKELLNTNSNVNEKNVDLLTLSYFEKQKLFSLAEDYYHYLKEKNLEVNLAVLGKYLKLLYLMRENKTEGKCGEEEILSIYENLKKTYNILDPRTNENLICALSTTKNWRECFKLLDDIRKVCTPSTESYNVCASTAFLNGEKDVGWAILEEMIEKNRIPTNKPYLSYLKTCENTQEKSSQIQSLEMLFNFFGYHDIVCDQEVSDKIQEIATKWGYKVKNSTINARGYCKNCNKKLQNSLLSDQEFVVLKDAFFKNAIIGKNVYNKTNPEEVEAFRNFVRNMGRFDVVVDGLNVAFTGGKTSNLNASRMVVAVIRHFWQQGKKVLVIGRKHMKNWPVKNWNYINNYSTVFLTENISYDDPFLLYCALNSGNNTVIISRDLMRGHCFLLKGVHYRTLFKRWLSSCRYELQYVNDYGKAVFKRPLPYVKQAQNSDKFWHLPCKIESKDEITSNEKWICLHLV